MARKFTRKRWRRPERMTLEHPPVMRRKDIGAPDMLTLETELERQTTRKRAATMIAVYVLVAAIEGVVVGLVAGMLWLAAVFAALAIAYVAVLRGTGGRLIARAVGAETARNPRINRYVQHLAKQAAMPVPEALVVRGDRPNAVAIGLEPRAVVVTTGSLNLEDLTLEALIAHEIVHVRDEDAYLASLYVALVAPHQLIPQNGAIAVLLAPVAVLLAPAAIAIAAARSLLFPPDYEHRADVAAALLTQYPPGVASGLRRAKGTPPGPRAAARFWFAPVSDERAELIEEM